MSKGLIIGAVAFFLLCCAFGGVVMVRLLDSEGQYAWKAEPPDAGQN